MKDVYGVIRNNRKYKSDYHLNNHTHSILDQSTLNQCQQYQQYLDHHQKYNKQYDKHDLNSMDSDLNKSHKLSVSTKNSKLSSLIYSKKTENSIKSHNSIPKNHINGNSGNGKSIWHLTKTFSTCNILENNNDNEQAFINRNSRFRPK